MREMSREERVGKVALYVLDLVDEFLREDCKTCSGLLGLDHNDE